VTSFAADQNDVDGVGNNDEQDDDDGDSDDGDDDDTYAHVELAKRIQRKLAYLFHRIIC
jgi:hypothetical protein